MSKKHGMPKKEKRPNYLELKKLAKKSIEKALERHGNILIDKTISYLSLETGLGRGCIARIIEETVSLMEPRAKEKGIALSFSLENLKPIQADPKNIEEIFNNLITNAINYSPDGGQVGVTARCLGEYMEIKVKDTGVGIPPEELPKIFDKFYRVKHPKTRKIMGTGLGLAIVKGVVEAHHGTIDVESEADKGTTFRILLPVIRQPSSE